MSTEDKAEAAKVATEVAFDKFEQYFEAARQVLAQYQDQAKELGMQAIDLGLLVLRIEAFSELLFPLVVVIISLAYVKQTKTLWKWGIKATAERTHPGTAVPIVLGVFQFVWFTQLFNVWAWVGLFYPEVYAIHKLLLN